MSGTYCWLHYDVSQDSAICYVCMSAEFEKKCLASTKEILLSLLPAIREAIEAVETLPAQVQDIGELLDASTQSE